MTAVTPSDALQAAKMLMLAPPSWMLSPDRLWPAAQRLRSLSSPHREPPGLAPAVIAETLAGHFGAVEAAAVFRAWRCRQLEAQLQILALQYRHRRWEPVIRVHGLEQVSTALERGSGVVLWVSDFVYSSLLTKIAFHRAGFRVSHLSRPTHGFSVSPFGIRFLNPIWTRVEDRFLAERVTIADNDGGAALATLRRRLAGNGVVSITASETARRTREERFFRGTIRLATGPAHLAQRCVASLLPVFTVRTAEGGYDVTVGAPLDLSAEGGPDYAAAIRGYVAGLEPQVLAYPDQWSGWLALAREAERRAGYSLTT